MKITLTAVNRTPRVSKKTGKPFVSLGLKCNEYGDKWLSGFASVENADWEVGDSVDVEIEQKGEYLNFTTPKAEKAPQGDVNRVELIARDILTQLKTLGGEITAIKSVLSDILSKVDPAINEPEDPNFP